MRKENGKRLLLLSQAAGMALGVEMFYEALPFVQDSNDVNIIACQPKEDIMVKAVDI